MSNSTNFSNVYNPHLTEQKIINENNKQIVPKLRFDSSIISEQTINGIANKTQINTNAQLPKARAAASSTSTDISNLPPISNSFSPVSVNYRDAENTTFNSTFESTKNQSTAKNAKNVFEDLQLEINQMNDDSRISTAADKSPFQGQLALGRLDNLRGSYNDGNPQNQSGLIATGLLNESNQPGQSNQNQTQNLSTNDNDHHTSIHTQHQTNQNTSTSYHQNSLVEVLNKKVVDKRSNSSHNNDRKTFENDPVIKPSAYYDIKKAKETNPKKPKTPNISFYKNAKNQNQNKTPNFNSHMNTNNKFAEKDKRKVAVDSNSNNDFVQYEILGGESQKDGNNNSKNPLKIIKPMKKNYYQKMGTSRFMQKYDEITNQNEKPTQELTQNLNHNFQDPETNTVSIQNQQNFYANSSIDTLTNFDSPSNYGAQLYENDHHGMIGTFDYGHGDDTGVNSINFSDRSETSSPVESYLSYYKKASRTNSKSKESRHLITKSAPVSSASSTTPQYSRTNELGPTNTTIFNEIFTKDDLRKERESLKKQQLDYSKRLRHRANYNINFKIPSENRDGKRIIDKLKDNIEKSTKSHLYDNLGKKLGRTNTRERIERSTQVRNRAMNYAKDSIPKPRVVKRLNVIGDGARAGGALGLGDSAAPASAGDIYNFERNERANELKSRTKNFVFGKPDQLTNTMRSQSYNEQRDNKDQEKNKTSGEDDKNMDDLLYMLARHKKEQNALNKLAS